MRRAMIVLCGLVIGTAACSSAAACDSPGSGWWQPYGFGYSGTLYGLNYIPVPPYYALHPPVYYSEPVKRSYGVSPFACRCHHPPEVVQEAPPQEVVNRYVVPLPEGAPADDADDQMAATPQWIENPFFDSGDAPRALVTWNPYARE